MLVNTREYSFIPITDATIYDTVNLVYYLLADNLILVLVVKCSCNHTVDLIRDDSAQSWVFLENLLKLIAHCDLFYIYSLLLRLLFSH